MYQCIICKAVQESPLLKPDRYDGEIYRYCRFCGGVAVKAAETCRCCGRELFPEERAYELNKDTYCMQCVAEVII